MYRLFYLWHNHKLFLYYILTIYIPSTLLHIMFMYMYMYNMNQFEINHSFISFIHSFIQSHAWRLSRDSKYNKRCFFSEAVAKGILAGIITTPPPPPDIYPADSYPPPPPGQLPPTMPFTLWIPPPSYMVFVHKI